MKKVYWDEKEQQIKTKDGSCKYDRTGNVEWRKKCNEVIDDTNQKATNFNTDIAKLKTQLQCAAKGHDMMFEKKIPCRTSRWSLYIEPSEDKYIFKCSNCSLEITKTKAELTAKEKEGLKKLKLL